MYKIILSACIACILSGCAQQQLAPVKAPPVKAAILSTTDTSRLAKGTTTVTVRSFKRKSPSDKSASSQEIVGASCQIESDELRAKVITPQEVIVPNFKQRGSFPKRGLPSALVATCETGTMRGVASTFPKAKQVTTAIGGGLAVALISVATSAAVANSTPWVYVPAISVPMAQK